LGGLAQTEMDHDFKTGSRGGVVGGKNPHGVGGAGWQLAIGTLQIVAAISPISKAKKFLGFLKKGKSLRVALSAGRAEVKVFTQLTAEEAQLIRRMPGDGKRVAGQLAEQGHIGRYDAFREFTAGHKGQYQAHHILEEQSLKELGVSFHDAPAVILDKNAHALLHQELNAARHEIADSVTSKTMTKREMWQLYKRVYTEHGIGHWLPVIEPYFR
jgi:hypothetical protein